MSCHTGVDKGLLVGSLLYQLQQFDPGMVWLDENNIVTAMNHRAMAVLGKRQERLIGQEVLQLHPEKSRDKVRFLLEECRCPVSSPPPMTMMINIPEQMLLIKVAKMIGAGGHYGICMIFYDLTELATIAGDKQIAESPRQEPVFARRLIKLPIYDNQQIRLIDLQTVACIKADGHYSTLQTADSRYFCNLSLMDLDERLDPQVFIRTHRSHIVNLAFAKALNKQAEQWHLVIDCQPEITVPISRNNVSRVKHCLGVV